MHQFPANALPRSLETFLEEVREQPNQPMRMPILLRFGGSFGGGTHAVQVIASWAVSAQAGPELHLPREFALQEHTRERFASTLPGMAALYFSNSIRCGEVEFDRFRALMAVAPRVQAMQDQVFRDTLRGQGAALCCFSGAKNEFLRSLYSLPEPGQVRDVSEFRVLLSKMLHTGAAASRALTEGQLDYLSGLVYQLFLNSDEHGAYSPDGMRMERSVRGISVRHTSVSDIGALMKMASDDAPLKTYLLKLGFQKNTGVGELGSMQKIPGGPMHLVEISVFDTGPGIGLHWLSQKEGRCSYSDFSLSEEIEAVQTCFQKHATTKASQFFGQGLSSALTAMKRLNAFMTLRTGRLSLYQDFSRPEAMEFKPKNRFPSSGGVPEISGTGYTICFRVK